VWERDAAPTGPPARPPLSLFGGAAGVAACLWGVLPCRVWGGQLGREPGAELPPRGVSYFEVFCRKHTPPGPRSLCTEKLAAQPLPHSGILRLAASSWEAYAPLWEECWRLACDPCSRLGVRLVGMLPFGSSAGSLDSSGPLVGLAPTLEVTIRPAP
jgi:hypothetical protein